MWSKEKQSLLRARTKDLRLAKNKAKQLAEKTKLYMQKIKIF